MAGADCVVAGGLFVSVAGVLSSRAPPCFWPCMAVRKVGREDEQFSDGCFVLLSNMVFKPLQRRLSKI